MSSIASHRALVLFFFAIFVRSSLARVMASSKKQLLIFLQSFEGFTSVLSYFVLSAFLGILCCLGLLDWGGLLHCFICLGSSLVESGLKELVVYTVTGCFICGLQPLVTNIPPSSLSFSISVDPPHRHLSDSGHPPNSALNFDLGLKSISNSSQIKRGCHPL